MMRFEPTEHPHRRLNPLTAEWVQVSPHRTQRPWQGQVDPPNVEPLPSYDPTCYLCPGNERANGEKNPEYADTFVFTNDFSALLDITTEAHSVAHPLLRLERVQGTCRVVCYSPRHDLTLAEMEIDAITRVIATWAAQTAELSERFRWVQVFQNQGVMMGASNPHPHGQIWALDALPNIPSSEDREQRQYAESAGQALLLDYANLEIGRRERVVVENEDWLVVVPYWATWPFETLLIPKRHILRLQDLTTSEHSSLAQTLRRLLVRYDNLFQISFPYSMGWHGAPEAGDDHWQLHAHFYPPLLRSAAIRKFMVGYEMLAESQRDIAPEQAAERLRMLSSVHYKAKGATR